MANLAPYLQNDGTLNISDILNEVISGGGGVGPLRDALTSKEHSAQAIADTMKAAVPTAIAQKKADLATQVQEGEDYKKTAQLLGSDVLEPNSAVNVSAAMLRDTITRSQQDINEIERKSAISFWNHPVDYVAAQFTIGDNKKDLERHAQEAAVLTQGISQLSQSATTTTETHNKLLEATTKEDAANLLSLFGNKAKIDADNASMQAFGVTAEKLKTLHALSDTQLSQLIQLTNAAASQESARALREQRQEKITDDAQLQNTVNAAQQFLGSAPMSVAAVKLLPTAERDRLLTIGSNVLAGGVTPFQTPGDAAVTLAAKRSTLKGPAIDLLKELTGVATQEITQFSPGTKINDNNVASVINTKLFGDGKKDFGIIGKMMSTAADNVTVGDGHSARTYKNIYQIGDVPTITSVNPTTLDSPFGKAVLAPALNSPADAARNSNPVQLADAAVAAMLSSGTPADEMAKGMAHFYLAGVDFQNRFVGNYSKYALPPLKGYVMNGVDWTNKEQIRKYLEKRAVFVGINSRIRQYTPNIGSPDFSQFLPTAENISNLAAKDKSAMQQMNKNATDVGRPLKPGEYRYWTPNGEQIGKYGE